MIHSSKVKHPRCAAVISMGDNDESRPTKRQKTSTDQGLPHSTVAAFSGSDAEETQHYGSDSEETQHYGSDTTQVYEPVSPPPPLEPVSPPPPATLLENVCSVISAWEDISHRMENIPYFWDESKHGPVHLAISQFFRHQERHMRSTLERAKNQISALEHAAPP